jgi:hypothetical protein
MHSEYELLATPYLLHEGQYKGQLKGILFFAQSKTDRMQWFVVNCGQFEIAFSEFLPHGLVGEIMEKLMRGEEVAFPEHYRKEQFDGGFHFAWWGTPARFKPPAPDALGRFLWGV